jgi:aminopeptidase YwaD
MPKILRILLVAIFIFSLVACAQTAPTLAPATPTLAPTPAVRVAASDFDASRAMQHNRELAVAIGSRVAGTDAGRRAGDYIAGQFESFGLATQKQPFNFTAWEDRGTRVEITAPDVRALEARPLQYSPPGSVEAEVVAVGGIGSESDFAKVSVKDRIALVQRGEIPFSTKAKNAQQAGALATLIYNNAPGAFGGTLQDRVSIPAIGVSGREGQALLDALRNGAVKVKIASDTRIEEKEGRNIIATKRGATDRIIVIGGHYDSVEAGPGANDNASGTAVVLELARVFAGKQTQHTLVFIAFDAEEFGLYGSRHYVEQLSQTERSRIVAMLNFDMLGGGLGPLLAGGDGALGKIARDAASALNIDARNFSLGSGASSDHAPFQRVGIDTVFFSRDYNLLHTPQDVFSEIREQWLDEAGRVAAKVVEELDK